MKSKMAGPVKFKVKNRRESNSVLSDTEILFPCFATKFEIRLYFQQFNVNLFQEWRFPLRCLTRIDDDARFSNESSALELKQVRAKQQFNNTAQTQPWSTNRKNISKKTFSVIVLKTKVLLFVSSKITEVVNFLQLVLARNSLCMPK